MSQILHIFRKDTRRFWPEIGVSLAVLVGLAGASEYSWRRLFDSTGSHGGMVSSAISLPLLLMASWWLLITRVIHAESLVGDRQFWVTRPYDWKKLLAAKAVFLFAYLYFPLAIAQWMMLKGAGMHPQWHVAGLLFNLLLITLYVVIPCVALACVTADMARMVLAMVGIFACMVGLITLSSKIWGATLGPPLPDAIWILRGVLLCFCVGAIVLQYATRRTWVARLVLLLIPVCVLAVTEFAPFNAIERAYAQSGGAADATPHLIYSMPENAGVLATAQADKEIVLGIPIEAVGLADKTILAIDHAKMLVEAPDGTRWVSPWQGGGGVPVIRRGTVEFVLPRSIYSSLVGKPLSVHLTLAISEGKEESSSIVPLPSRGLAVDGDGICSATIRSSEDQAQTTEDVRARCRFPMRRPYQHEALLTLEPGCYADGGEWIGLLTSEPADFAIDPVWPDLGINVGHSSRQPGGTAKLCTATAMKLTQYGLERRIQVGVTISNYSLPVLVAHSNDSAD